MPITAHLFDRLQLVALLVLGRQHPGGGHAELVPFPSHVLDENAKLEFKNTYMSERALGTSFSEACRRGQNRVFVVVTATPTRTNNEGLRSAPRAGRSFFRLREGEGREERADLRSKGIRKQAIAR